VFVDVYQKTARGGLAVDVVYKEPAIGVSPPPNTYVPVFPTRNWTLELEAP